MDLYIDSGTHVDSNLKERKQRIEDAIGNPQRIFYEGDNSAFSYQEIKSLALMTVFAPLVAFAAAFQIYIVIEFLGRAVSKYWPRDIGRDEDLVDWLKEEHDIESQDVDIGVSAFIANHWFASAIINWLGVAFVYSAFWAQSSLLVSIFELSVTLLLSYALLHLFLALSLPFRNHHIADAISEKQNEFDRACLVTGEGHHASVGDLLEKEPGINVINPVPESPSSSTKFAILLFERVNRVQTKIAPHLKAVTGTPLYHVRWPVLAVSLILGLRYTAIGEFNIAQSGNLFLTTLASVQAAIFAIVFSIIILGVNLSANRYSPRLASTFRSDSSFRWTVAIFGFSIALNLAGIYLSDTISSQEINIVVLVSGAFALGAFWTLYDFVNYTLERTTPEGILATLNQNMTVPSMVKQAHASADDFRNHGPFLVLVSVIRSTISEKDTVSAGKGLELLSDRISQLIMYADEDKFEEGAPVFVSLQTLCVEQFPDILEEAKNAGLNQIAVKVTEKAVKIGEASVDRELDSILAFVVRGQAELIDTIGYDGQSERIREEIMDSCKETLQYAAENKVWTGAAIGVRLLGWLSASSINSRSADENLDRRYTSLLILGFPQIATTIVNADFNVRDISISRWIRVHSLTDMVEPGQQLIGSCYSSQAELTSAAIRYEIRTESSFLDWQSVAAGWSDPVEDLNDADIESMAELWYGTILYLQYIEAETPDYVMAGFNPNVRFHLPDEFILSVIDGVLAGDFDPKARIDLLPGWVDPVELPLTGSKASPVPDPDESFHDWPQRRRRVIGAGLGGGWGARDLDLGDNKEPDRD